MNKSEILNLLNIDLVNYRLCFNDAIKMDRESFIQLFDPINNPINLFFDMNLEQLNKVFQSFYFEIWNGVCIDSIQLSHDHLRFFIPSDLDENCRVIHVHSHKKKKNHQYVFDHFWVQKIEYLKNPQNKTYHFVRECLIDRDKGKFSRVEFHENPFNLESINYSGSLFNYLLFKEHDKLVNKNQFHLTQLFYKRDSNIVKYIEYFNGKRYSYDELKNILGCFIHQDKLTMDILASWSLNVVATDDELALLDMISI